MADYTVQVVDKTIVVQPFGSDALLPLVGAANLAAADADAARDEVVGLANSLFRAGPIADRGPTPFQDYAHGLHYYANDLNPPRLFAWCKAGQRNPNGVVVSEDSWFAYYTPAEIKNLGIDFTGELPAANVSGLVDALADIAALQAPVISDFRAKALSTATHPDVLLSWALSGSEPASVTVGWGGFEVGVSTRAREFAPKDWAASKPLFVRGNSLSDITGRTDKWSQLLAASLGVTLYSTAKWSSDARQVYRSGAAEIWLTLLDNLLTAAGTARSVTHINGAAPSADSTVSPQSFLNEAPGTTGTDNVSMTGTIIDGAETRHVTVSIPNSGSTAYSVMQDAGQAELALSGPVLFVPDVARQVAQADNIIWTGNNYFYSGVPNTYGDHTNPAMWVDLARMIAQCEGQRVLILPVIPDATWTDRGLGTPYTAMLAANARTETLYPQYVARDALGRTLLERLQAAGDGSANDNADVAGGFVPRSLRADSLHLNAAGDAVVAAFVEEAFAEQALPPAITQTTMFTLTATPAAGEPVNAVATVEADALGALSTLGNLIDGQWKRTSGLPRLLLNGTGTVTIDARNRAGTITEGVFEATISGASDQIDYPFFGNDAVEVRATLTGTATAEIV